MMPSWLVLSACGLSWPEPARCEEPHLYYSPTAGVEDVYFGCEPPPGWLSNPPDEERYAAPEDEPDPPALGPPGEAVVVSEPEELVDEASAYEREVFDTALVEFPGTGHTGDTALLEREDRPPPEDTAELPPEDTSAPPEADSGDTGERDDSGDTGAEPDTGDRRGRRGRHDTGAPPPQDTGRPPPRETGAP